MENNEEVVVEQSEQQVEQPNELKAAFGDLGKAIKSTAIAAKDAMVKGIDKVDEKLNQVANKIEDKIDINKETREVSAFFETQATAYLTNDKKTVYAIKDEAAMTMTFRKSDQGLIRDGTELAQGNDLLALYGIDKVKTFKFEAGGNEYALECFKAKFKDAFVIKALDKIQQAILAYKPGLFGKGKYAEVKELFGEFNAAMDKGQPLDEVSYNRFVKLLDPMVSDDVMNVINDVQKKYS